MTNKLHSLQIFTDPSLPISVFTHGDLSDRNLLAERIPALETESPASSTEPDGSPQPATVRISGWVDWEFSGFYTPFEKFLCLEDEEDFVAATPLTDSTNDRIEADALPKPVGPRDAFYEALEHLGVSTPTGIDRDGQPGYVSRHWRTAQLLYGVQQHVAPWYVRTKLDAGNSDVAQEVEEAGVALTDALRELDGLCR